MSFFLTLITYLQPHSLGYHANVNADKHHSIWPIRFRHDESTTVQPGEEAPCILATFAVAHLKRRRESEPLCHTPLLAERRPNHIRRDWLGKTKESNSHDTVALSDLHVFKNKANIMKEVWLFWVEKYKGKVVISSGETIHWPMVEEGAANRQQIMHWRVLLGLHRKLVHASFPVLTNKSCLHFPGERFTSTNHQSRDVLASLSYTATLSTHPDMATIS